MSIPLLHIAERLRRKGSVVLPGIGKLSLICVPAQWDPAAGKITPPRQDIRFERTKDTADNSFNQYVAQKLHITIEEAAAQWNKFLHRLQQEDGSPIDIPGIGSIKREPAEGWAFTPLQPVFADWEPVSAALVRHETAKAAVIPPVTPAGMPETVRNNRPWWRIGIAAAGVVVLVILFLVILHRLTKREAAVNPQKDNSSNTIVSGTADSAAKAPPYQPPPPTAVNDSLHYNIVFATYTSVDRAEKQWKKLQNWGHHIILLRNDTGSLFRLAVPFVSLPADTAAMLDEVRKDYGHNVYIVYPPAR